MPVGVTLAFIIGGFGPVLAGTATGFVLGSALVAAGLAAVSYLLAPAPPDLGAVRPDTRTTRRSAVAPARWILGRARVGGLLAFWHESEGPDGAEDLDIVLVLSEGPCDQIERVWINGAEITMERTARTGSGESGHLIQPAAGQDYRDNLHIYEYFTGDGLEGDSLRAAAPDDWTDAHKLTGLAWVHVRLRQPSYGRDVDARVWARFPDLEFLVAGIKITWPGQATAVWTENAAALRYWWLRNRRGLPASAVDEPSVTAAHALCDQDVTVSLPSDYADYEPSAKRYAVNGVVHADDDPERVEAELDFCWQGWAVEVDGVIKFRAGADRTVARAITADDIISVDSVKPAPAIQDRVNAASIALAQSQEHDWLAISLPELEDTAARTRDGEHLPKDLGTRPFLGDPIAAGRLLAIQLRRGRASAAYSYRLLPGDSFEWFSIIPTDWVTITDPEHFFDEAAAMVLRAVVNEDWSVTLDLVEQPAGVYADTLVLPPLKPRALTIPKIRTVPAVTGLTATHTHTISRDGTVVWHVDVTWDDAPYYTRVRVTDGDDTIAEQLRTLVHEETIGGTRERFTVDTPGTYTVSAYHVTLGGFASPAATTTITFGWSNVPVPAATVISAEQYGAQLQIAALPIANRDVIGMEIRYTRGDIDGTEALAAIDESGWFDANLADVGLLSPIASTEPVVCVVTIPASGRYRLFARLFNRVGNYGPISEIGYKLLLIPAVETLSPQQWPLWMGTLNNLYRWTRDEQYRLLPDYDTPSNLTRDQLNGVEGWPFGPIEGYDASMSDTGSTYYESAVIDLGGLSNLDVTMDIEPHDPVAGVVTRADIETGRVVVAAGTDIELYDANGATATGILKSAAGTLDLTDALAIAEIRYDSTNSKIRFDRKTADTGGFDDWADDNQGLSFYVEVGGTVEELPVEDVAASGAAYSEWDISSDFKTALDNQTAADRLLLLVAEAGQTPLAIVLPEDEHDFYLYHATGSTQPARSTFTETAISGLTRVNGVRYVAARVHLKKWKGLALQRFSPQIRRIA